MRTAHNGRGQAATTHLAKRNPVGALLRGQLPRLETGQNQGEVVSVVGATATVYQNLWLDYTGRAWDRLACSGARGGSSNQHPN